LVAQGQRFTAIFAANDQLAHELRTPLARIRGNIERLLSQPDPSSTRDVAIHALTEIDRATHLIQTILTVRAGESRTIKLQREPVRLWDLISESCELYAPAAEIKGLRLNSVLSEPEMEVNVDRQRLHQALCNLLDNAIAYTGSAGGRIAVHLEWEPDHALIRVCDNGPGLSENDHARIWRRFMRGSAASASAPGIGLGLSLVHSIAIAHGGDAGARNHADGSNGAEFWIRLPRGA
jgi:signal transduction histidine kinase